MFPPLDVIIYLLAKHSLLIFSVYFLGLPEHNITKIPFSVTFLIVFIVFIESSLSLFLKVPSISINIAFIINLNSFIFPISQPLLLSSQYFHLHQYLT